MAQHRYGRSRFLPKRHIRAIEVGDAFEFRSQMRVVKDVKRHRDGGKSLTFIDGMVIDTSGPDFEDVHVDVDRPMTKFRPFVTPPQKAEDKKGQS